MTVDGVGIDTLTCEDCGKTSGSKSSRPVNAFICPECGGTMWREGHGPEARGDT